MSLNENEPSLNENQPGTNPAPPEMGSKAANVRHWVWLLRRLSPEFLLGALGFAGLLLLGSAVGARPGWSGGWRELSATVLVFGFSHCLAVIFQHIPRGPEQGLARLSLAAFCRTFAPLLALLTIDNYIFPLLNQTNAGSIITAYLVSLGLTFAMAGKQLPE